MLNRLLPAIAVAVAALFIVLALAACGGGGNSGGVASVDGSSQSETDGTATTGTQDPQEAALAFAKCMREHGVNVPDPGADGGIQLNVGPGDDSAKVEKAQKACQPLLENAAPQLSEEQQSVMQDAALAFARCMRKHGIDMPDPQFGDGGIVTQQGSRGGAGPDPDDPKFKAAQEACQPIMDKAAREAGLPAQKPSTNRSGEDGS
jgi:hypothetical protein